MMTNFIVDLTNGCYVWFGAIQTNGYGHLGRNGKTLLAHRVAWEESFGEIPKGKLVLHHCDNRRCVNPEHLFIGTAEDNTRDMIKKGRGYFPGPPRGEKNQKAKLSDIDVKALLLLYASGKTRAFCAKKFGCHWNTANNIVSGRTRNG